MYANRGILGARHREAVLKIRVLTRTARERFLCNRAGLRWRLIWAAGILYSVLGVAAAIAGEKDATVIAPLLAEVAAKAAAAEKAGQSALAGRDGWLYFAPELRAISVGAFWGDKAAFVSRASKPENADPLEAIVDFHGQLKKAGIELLVVPVPAKIAVYPEPILDKMPKPGSGKVPRLDVYHQEFYGLLRERGIEVVDLLPVFLEKRTAADGELYCKTDSHWSGRGVVVAAEAIAGRIAGRPWLHALSKEVYATEDRSVTITGDLAKMINESEPASEKLTVTLAGRKMGDRVVRIEPARDSPVLLMGDSHTLVFHDPTLFASGAGLPDHLARRLGFPVDLIGVRGSGATTTRIELLRRQDNLKGKKLVVWCFSFREFTESVTGWRKVPVIR